jgi:hypothetical protein
MMQIYCLVNPITNQPFYVGATKVILKNRLSAHIHEALTFRLNKYVPQISQNKHAIIKELTESNLKPKIDLLFISPLPAVEYYEAFFYDMLKKQGFTLFNSPSHFNYLKYNKIKYYQYPKIL